MKILICFAALLALSAGAAIEGQYVAEDIPQSRVPRLIDNRIIGGAPADVAQYPHQISMRYKNIFFPENPFAHRCGGSIYSKDIVVTAAHCIIAVVPSQLQVVAGTNFRRGSNGWISRVKEIIMHEDYDPETFDNDIALLVLANSLPLNNFTMKAVELSAEDPRAGAMSTITGWGTTAENGSPADTLQEVQVPIISKEQCNEDYDGLITDAMLCSGLRGVGGKDACQGDSGGPLLVNGKLAGVVSWGYGCARPEYPGVYAKVSYLLPWLMEKIALVNGQK